MTGEPRVGLARLAWANEADHTPQINQITWRRADERGALLWADLLWADSVAAKTGDGARWWHE